MDPVPPSAIVVLRAVIAQSIVSVLGVPCLCSRVLLGIIMVTCEVRHLIILLTLIMVEGATTIDAEGLIAEAHPTREVEEEEEAETETIREITIVTTTTETITIVVPAATVEGIRVIGEGGNVIGLMIVRARDLAGGRGEAGVRVVHEADTEGEAAVQVAALTVAEVEATLVKGRHAEIVKAMKT